MVRNRSRIHFARAVLAWVTIGVTINVTLTLGVIWIAPSDYEGFGWSSPLPQSPEWPHPPPSDWSQVPQIRTTHLGLGWSVAQFYDSTPAPRSRDEYKDQHHFVMQDFGYGFPSTWLCRWRTSTSTLPGTGTTRADHGVWIGVLPVFGLVLVPYVPFWPGFALNTIFYAAIAWGLWQIPLAIRRRRRRRLNRCVKCGYDLKGLAPASACPECGGIAVQSSECRVQRKGP